MSYSKTYAKSAPCMREIYHPPHTVIYLYIFRSLSRLDLSSPTTLSNNLVVDIHKLLTGNGLFFAQELRNLIHDITVTLKQILSLLIALLKEIHNLVIDLSGSLVTTVKH